MFSFWASRSQQTAIDLAGRRCVIMLLLHSLERLQRMRAVLSLHNAAVAIAPLPIVARIALPITIVRERRAEVAENASFKTVGWIIFG